LALAEGKRRRDERGGRAHDGAPKVRERDPTARGGIDERHSPCVAAGGEEGDNVEVTDGGEQDGRALAAERGGGPAMEQQRTGWEGGGSPALGGGGGPPAYRGWRREDLVAATRWD
jgi:hypothetical protein